MKRSVGNKNLLFVTLSFFLMFVFIFSISSVEAREQNSERDISPGSERTIVEQVCESRWSAGSYENTSCGKGTYSDKQLSGACSTVGASNVYYEEDLSSGTCGFDSYGASFGLFLLYKQTCLVTEPGCECPGDFIHTPSEWSDSVKLTAYVCSLEGSLGKELTGTCNAGDTHIYHKVVSSTECGSTSGVLNDKFELNFQTCLEAETICIEAEPEIPDELCGDGYVEQEDFDDDYEECDDGNTDDNDGCSSNCEIEAGYTCTIDKKWRTGDYGGSSKCSKSETRCCDDDDNDNWMGSSPLWRWSLLGCSNLYFGKEKVCSEYSFKGSEIGDCDEDASRNPGVTEICGNEIDDNCDGEVDEDCAVVPEVGNGVIEEGEECDDGNMVNNDGCSSQGLIEEGYVCDGKNPTICAKVGDGIVEGPEECDDGNTDDNDGCSSQGLIESGYTCDGESPSTCAKVGDGIISSVEECDDGNTNNNDGCSSKGKIEPGYVCDKESPSTCAEVGDGKVEGPEECDDGNTISGDGCSSQGLIEEGYTCDEESPTTCYETGTVYWADMNGNGIDRADLGDTVQLIIEGAVSGTFSIKEDDILFDDDIRDVSGESKYGNWVGIWTIEQSDLDNTADYDEFYFEVNGKRSEHLKIGKEESDSLMTVSILGGIECGEYFDEGASTTVVILASDSDDLIVGNVSINGDSIAFSNGGVRFNQVFDTPGNIQILIEADTLTGDDKKRVISNVMVLEKDGNSYVDASYVAACIVKPEDFSNIVDKVVDFDVSGTRGVRVTDGIVEELIPGKDAFSWYWTFYPQGLERNFENSVDRFAYIFTARFPIAGVNTAELRVEVN